MPFIIDGSTGFLIPDGAGISLTDDDKLQLGTGDDLQIYHDGTTNNSYIKESGTGHLIVQGQEIQFDNASGTSLMNLSATQIEMLHNGTKVLETTSNGIDVTGVGTNFKSATYNILNLQTDTNNDGTSDDGIFKITNGSAGTTKAEFRWDESEDTVQIAYGDHGRSIVIDSNHRVGINYSSPATTGAQLTVQGPAGSNAVAVLGNGTSGNSWGLGVNAGSTSADASFRVYDKDGSASYLFVRGDGVVGIGTATPTEKLDVRGRAYIENNGVNYARIGTSYSGHYFESQSWDNYDGFEIYQQHGSNTTRNSFIVNDNRTGSKTASFVVRGDGNVGIGVDDPTDKLTLTVGNGGGILQSTYYSGTATNGQKMGVIGFKGYSQGNTVAGADAKIEAVAAGNHSGSSAPANLDFYTKPESIGPGSAAILRHRIHEEGHQTIYKGTNNWSVQRHNQSSGCYVCHRLYGAGSSTTTYNLLRYRRHYWGSGSVKFTLSQTYYSGTAEGEYWLTGHGRSDGSYNPSYSIAYVEVYNGPGSGRLSTNMPGGAPGNSDAEIVDVSISIPAYYYYMVRVEVSHSEYYTTTSTMGSVNSFALYT